jgi:co-chaperonin GroES (HSP10)
MLRPLHDRVVVKCSERVLSSIVYAVNRESMNEGTIVAVGPRVKTAQPGEFIKYGNGSYLDWPIHEMDGQKFQIIQEADIACVVDNL